MSTSPSPTDSVRAVRAVTLSEATAVVAATPQRDPWPAPDPRVRVIDQLCRERDLEPLREEEYPAALATTRVTGCPTNPEAVVAAQLTTFLRAARGVTAGDGTAPAAVRGAGQKDHRSARTDPGRDPREGVRSALGSGQVRVEVRTEQILSLTLEAEEVAELLDEDGQWLPGHRRALTERALRAAERGEVIWHTEHSESTVAGRG